MSFIGSNNKTIETIDIVIPQYTLHLNKEYFNAVKEQAAESGYDYNDSGPLQTIRRMLFCEGISSLDPALKDPADGYRVTIGAIE